MAAKNNLIRDDDDDQDDDVSVLYSTPPSVEIGTCKSNSISVEDYRCKSVQIKIDDDDNDNDGDDDVTLIQFIRRKRFLKGECSNSKPFLCEICYEEKPRSEIFRIKNCIHYYCLECARKYVSSRLKNNVVNIKCPVVRCKGVVEPHHCRSILPSEVFERWGDSLREAAILASERLYCPYKDCAALLIVDGEYEDFKVMCRSKCPCCYRMFCARCNVPWHAGASCSEYKELRKYKRGSDQDIMVINLAKKNKWGRCHNCKSNMEQIGGYAYVRCRCGCFCCICGYRYTPGHYCL